MKQILKYIGIVIAGFLAHPTGALWTQPYQPTGHGGGKVGQPSNPQPGPKSLF